MASSVSLKTEKFIFHQILAFKLMKGHYPSVKELAFRTGYSRDLVKKAFNNLKKKRFLEPIGKYSSGLKLTEYRIAKRDEENGY